MQVVLILEILIRKCGFDAIDLITPDKFKGFVRSVEEVRFKLLTCHLDVETICYFFDQWGMPLVSSCYELYIGNGWLRAKSIACAPVTYFGSPIYVFVNSSMPG